MSQEHLSSEIIAKPTEWDNKEWAHLSEEAYYEQRAEHHRETAEHEHSVAVAFREGFSAIINDCVNNHDCEWKPGHDEKVVVLLNKVRDTGWTP